MNALSSTMALATTSLSTGSVAELELIRRCDEHAGLIAAVNASKVDLADDCPDCAAYETNKSYILYTPAKTMAGVLAKIRAARAEAAGVDGEEADDGPAGTPGAYIVWDACRELLAMEAGEDVAGPPACHSDANDASPLNAGAILAFQAAEQSPSSDGEFVGTFARVTQEWLGDHTDAGLIAVCAEHDALEQAYQATDFKADSSTAYGQAVIKEQCRYYAAQKPLVKRMVALRATTMAGHQARARSLALSRMELMKPDPGEAAECLMMAIVRDLIGSAVR